MLSRQLKRSVFKDWLVEVFEFEVIAMVAVDTIFSGLVGWIDAIGRNGWEKVSG